MEDLRWPPKVCLSAEYHDVTSQILSPIVQSCQMDQNEEGNKKKSCGRNFNPATGGVPPPPNPNFWKFSSISKHRHVTPH